MAGLAFKTYRLWKRSESTECKYLQCAEASWTCSMFSCCLSFQYTIAEPQESWMFHKSFSSFRVHGVPMTKIAFLDQTLPLPSTSRLPGFQEGAGLHHGRYLTSCYSPWPQRNLKKIKSWLPSTKDKQPITDETTKVKGKKNIKTGDTNPESRKIFCCLN